MNAVELDHPTGSVLTAYSLGQLSEPDLAGIDGHLAECAVCRQVVEGVAPDTLVALLRSADTDVVNSETTMGARPPAALDGHPRYRVGELLGVGGMGAVYKAEHLLMERPVALKVLKRELIDRPATMERFRREVRAAARLTHPNIVAAFDAEQVEDVHFLVMEYVEGVSLAKRSAEQGPLPVTEACDYIRQAALGLQHAHSCGMVHRDIKPQNLMLTPSGQVKILDFGLARFVVEGRGHTSGEWRVASGEKIQETSGEGHKVTPIPSPLPPPADPVSVQAPVGGGRGAGVRGAQDDSCPAPVHRQTSSVHRSSLTHSGLTMGTPDYIAPEQVRDSHLADIRADIYSLGCTLYDLLAGHAPFPDGNATQKVKAHLERTPAPLRSLRRDVPVELARVVERMMAKDPADRYQTPAEVAAALGRFVKPHPLSRKRWLGLAGALGVVAALVAGVIIYVQTDHGTITVETNDDKIAVMIEKAGGVKIIDKANNREYLLRPGTQAIPGGDYEIEVAEALAGLDFQTKEFKLRRGKEVRLTARFVAKGEGQVGTRTSLEERIREEEHLKLLRMIATQLEKQYKGGTTPFDKVIQAKRDVAKSELGLAESERERLRALESLLALAQDFVKLRKSQFEAGTVTQVYLLKANAELLEAQATLEWAKNRVPAQASGKDDGLRYGGKSAGYWLDQLQDANWKFRVEAVEALGSIAQKNKKLIPILVAALGDKSSSVGSAAVRAIGALGPDALPALLEVLKEKKSPTAVGRAAVAIGQIGPDAKDAVPLLSQALKTNDWPIRASAIYSLGKIGPVGKSAIAGIVSVYGDYLKNGPIDLLDAWDSYGFNRSYTGFAEMVYEVLSRIDPSIIDAANKELRGLRIYDKNSREDWPKLYTWLTKRYPTAVGAPLPGGKADGGTDGPLYGGKPARYWLDQLQDANPKFRVEAVSALGALAQKDKWLIPRLIDALADKGDSQGKGPGGGIAVASAAARALSRLGSDAVPALMDVLTKKGSPTTRCSAADALGWIGPDAKSSIPLLIALIQSQNPSMRRSTIGALGSIGPEAKDAIPAIVDELGAHLKQANQELKKAKSNDFETFRSFDGPNSYTAFLMRAMIKIEPGVAELAAPGSQSAKGPREFAEKQLEQWKRTYEALKKKYPGPTPHAENTRGRTDNAGSPSPAAEANPLYRGKPAAYWLEQLKDGDPRFRVDAVEALGNIAQKNKELIPVVAGALSDKDYEVGSKAAEVLAGFGPDIVPVLVDALKDNGSPAAIRNGAMAVQRIGPAANAAVPALSQALRIDDWNVRRASIIALGNIGPDAKPALPAMVNVLGVYLKLPAEQRVAMPGYFVGPGSGGRGTTLEAAKKKRAKFGGSTEAFLQIFGRALLRIDSTKDMILPPVTTTLSPEGFDGDGAKENIAGWQQFYESLKTKYPAPPANPNRSQESSTNALPPQRHTEPNGLYRGKPAAYWVEQFKDADPKLRADAVIALGIIAEKDKSLVSVLVASLGDNDNTVASEASKALSNLGPSSVPVLLEVLNAKPSDGAFCQAAYALGRIGAEAKAAVPILTKELTRTTGPAANWDTAIATRFALTGIGPAAKAALPALADSLGAYLERVKGQPGLGRLAGAQMWPRRTVDAVIKIDPDAQKVLPSEFYQAGVYRNRAIQDIGELTKLWQQTYEALKKRYPER